MPDKDTVNYECQECHNTFKSTKNPWSVKCPKCGSQDLEVFG